VGHWMLDTRWWMVGGRRLVDTGILDAGYWILDAAADVSAPFSVLFWLNFKTVALILAVMLQIYWHAL